MQNTKKNTIATLCVVLSELQVAKLTEATYKLHHKFGSTELEQSIFSLLQGWICDEELEQMQPNERAKIIGFLFEFLTHFQTIDKFDRHSETNKFQIDGFLYLWQIESSVTKNYFQTLKQGFLNSIIADNTTTRTETLYRISTIENYIEEIQLLNPQFN